MGYLSDRFGRKIVLVPALLYSSTLVASLAFCEQGPLFTLVIIMLGLSIRSDYSLVNATIIDIVRNRAETTMLGVLSLVRHLMGASAPIIAGFLYQFVGIQTPFLFVAALFLISALIFSTVNIHK
jgi:ACDE family multidrug resistance protein